MAKIFTYGAEEFTAPYCDERDKFCPIIKMLSNARKEGECNYELKSCNNDDTNVKINNLNIKANFCLDDLVSYCNKCTMER